MAMAQLSSRVGQAAYFVKLEHGLFLNLATSSLIHGAAGGARVDCTTSAAKSRLVSHNRINEKCENM